TCLGASFRRCNPSGHRSTTFIRVVEGYLRAYPDLRQTIQVPVSDGDVLVPERLITTPAPRGVALPSGARPSAVPRAGASISSGRERRRRHPGRLFRGSSGRPGPGLAPVHGRPAMLVAHGQGHRRASLSALPALTPPTALAATGVAATRVVTEN